MTKAKGFWAGIFLLIVGQSLFGANQRSVQIDLARQTAYLIDGRQIVLRSPISSGRAGHRTSSGSFKIIEKERNHFSSIYGKIVDASGRTIVADADADMAVPRGGRFIPAPMRYFMRFHGADGMHAGYLPGYPASHGCVRMPEQMAIAFFNAVEVGTPVEVRGYTEPTNRVERLQRYQYPEWRRRPWPGIPISPYPDPRFIPPPIPDRD